MFDYEGFFAERISDIKRDSSYRTYVVIERIAGRFPKAIHHHPDGPREITVWCSNDHLGMGQHPEAIKAMKASIEKSGIAAGGSRNIAGTNLNHVLLEEEIAQLHEKQRGLTFVTGYAANDASLAVLGKMLPNCVFFSDRLNHASMIQGMRLSGAEKRLFEHNDVRHLEKLLGDVDPNRPKVVAIESISSMEGDITPMAEICAIAKRHDALVYVDEVHSVGMYGPEGAGLAAELGIADQVDILMGNFSKGYGTAGGYVVGPDAIVDAIRSFGAPFIFTFPMPPALAAAALTNVRHLRESDEERRLLQQRASTLKQLLREARIPMVSEESHIVPVLVGDAHQCKQLADALLEEHAIYVQPINYPSVARGTERLRINPSPVHEHAEVVRFVEVLDKVWADLGSPRATHIAAKTA